MKTRPPVIIGNEASQTNIYYECSKCHSKFPEHVTALALGSVGQLVKIEKVPNPCPRCGGGTQRHVRALCLISLSPSNARSCQTQRLKDAIHSSILRMGKPKMLCLKLKKEVPYIICEKCKSIVCLGCSTKTPDSCPKCGYSRSNDL